MHEPDSLTERQTVLIEKDPELIGAPLWIGEAVTVSDVIVVQLHVEPRPSRTNVEVAAWSRRSTSPIFAMAASLHWPGCGLRPSM